MVVATASGVLQAQLANPQGDIQTLSRILGLKIDPRLSSDPAGYICKVKVIRLPFGRPGKGWKALHNWTQRTKVGARSEVPKVPDDLWEHVAWDASLPCDTCQYRGNCHVMAARREYRGAADLVIADHRLLALDLLTREERQQTGQMPLLPAYSAAVVDEGHHLPETWQRAQGYQLSAAGLSKTLDLIAGYAGRQGPGRGLAEARWQRRVRLATVLVEAARRESRQFIADVLAAAVPGEGKRHVRPDTAVRESGARLVSAVEAIQDDLSTEEQMQEGTAAELTLRAYQTRLDEVTAALSLFRSDAVVPWVEGEDLWVVPRNPLTLFGAGRLAPGTPLLFSSATLEPGYMARVLQLTQHEHSQVGVPFNLAEQVLIYQPAPADDEIAQVLAVIRAMRGRTLVLVNSLAEVERYRAALDTASLASPVLYEGDADRGAMLAAFRKDVASSLVGATFWEGVDVPGESLSCVIIPRLPFPAHDPLIRERREQAAAAGADPFLAVDLPEMLVRLKQGVGRLIRSSQDRGVLALLDQSYADKPWADRVAAALPQGSIHTAGLERLADF